MLTFNLMGPDGSRVSPIGSLCLKLLVVVLLAAFALTACARVETKTGYRSSKRMQKPDQVLIYDFRVKPGDVRVDGSVIAGAGDAVTGESGEDEVDVGRAAATSLSKKIVEELGAVGIVARRATGHPSSKENVVIVEGEFLSIDEGDVTQRTLIGFGMGASEVDARVQVFRLTPDGPLLIERFRTNVKSGRKPGLGPMGAGAAVTGNVGMVVGGAVTSVAAENTEGFLGADVEAGLRNTAKEIAKRGALFYVKRGWLPRSALE